VARAAAARSAAPAPQRTRQRPPRTAKPRPRPAAPRTLRARLRGLPHSPFVDRLLTGRAWIVLVAGLLAGIVFANVALLELNAGIARTTEKVAALKRENGRLRLQAARLGSTERIQRAAADLGLVLPAPGQVRYLKARPGRDASLALKRMSAPDPIAAAAPVPAVPAPAPVAPAPAPTAAAPAPPEAAPVVAETAPPAATAPVDPTTAPPPAGATGQTG
jgi:cell division protein FtsL